MASNNLHTVSLLNFRTECLFSTSVLRGVVMKELKIYCLFYSIFQLNFWTKMINSLKVKTRQTGGTTSPFYTWRYLKGIWNEKFGLKKTLLFERIFEITKIGLYSSRVSHFSLEIFGCTALHNDLLGIKYIFEIIPFNRSKVCWFSASGYIHTCTVLSDFVRQPQWYSWFPKKSLCSV